MSLATRTAPCPACKQDQRVDSDGRCWRCFLPIATKETTMTQAPAELAPCRSCGEHPRLWTRGPLSGLCDVCAAPVRESMAAQQRDRERLQREERERNARIAHGIEPAPDGAIAHPEAPGPLEAAALAVAEAARRVDANRALDDEEERLRERLSEIERIKGDAAEAYHAALQALRNAS